MMNQLVGLENVPNVYITRIFLNDNTTQTYKVDVELEVLDKMEGDKTVWSSDKTFYKFLKICFIRTTNTKMAEYIKNGNSASPYEITKSEFFDEETVVEKIPISYFTKATTKTTCQYTNRVKFQEHFRTKNLTVFAFCYIDTVDLANFYRIELSGQLRQYNGAVTSERIISSSEVVKTTTVFLNPDNTIWTGPVHFQDGHYMEGSFHTTEGHQTLKNMIVQNLKLIDNRTINFPNREGLAKASDSIISDVHYSMNKDIDLFGLFSVNMKQFVLLKTKHGKRMFGLGGNIFQEFINTVAINSISAVKQQITTRMVGSTTGTPRVVTDKISSYDYIGTTVDESPGILKNVENLRQIYIDPNPLIRHYQFFDREQTSQSSGQFKYKVEITIADKSQSFIDQKIRDFQENLNILKEIIITLNRHSKFDYKLRKLKENVIVSSRVLNAITVYYNNLAYFKKISVDEIQTLINNKLNLFLSGNYQPSHGEQFLVEYEALLTTFLRKFKIVAKYNVTTRPKNNKKSLIPNIISISKEFQEIIQFEDYREFYDCLGLESDIKAAVDHEALNKRANLEVSRFFEPTKSPLPVDFDQLDPSVSSAVTSFDNAKKRFFAPLSFTSGPKKSSLTDLAKIDTKGVAKRFFKAQKDKRNRKKPWKSGFKKPRNRKRKIRHLKSNTVAHSSRRRMQTKSIHRTPAHRFSFSIKTATKYYNSLNNALNIDSENFLGEGSEFVQAPVNIKEEIVDADREAINEQLESFMEPVNRAKSHYDISSPNNVIASYLSSKSYSKTRLKNMPMAFKALILSKSQAAKNNILESKSDVLAAPATKVATEMVFQTSQKLEMLVGHETDSNGLLIISKPIWAPFDDSLLSDKNAVICRLSYTEIPELGVVPSPQFKLPILNATFLLCNRDLEQNITEQIKSPEQKTNINMTTKNELSRNIKYATNNVVKQSQSKDPFARKSINTTTAETSRPNDMGGGY
tara:strand:- start:2002 stop:4920 length:2919 start_codon:yes stop_codon:yes gene_type:complete